MDFTIETYKLFLQSMQECDYSFLMVKEFINSKKSKAIILRHDVDLLPQNSLRFAKIQHQLGIQGSYYFRAVPQSWDENIIKEIASLGHEVGYHYENMDTCNGDIDKAWDNFRMNLDELRKLVDVKTICMHGSPRSKFDNKELWSKYDYRSLDLIGEPYYDVDFDKVLYLTDTGRRWDGWKTSVRDKVPQQKDWIKQGLVFHSTQDIINIFSTGQTLSASPELLPMSEAEGNRRGVEVPNQIMFTMHPQRWHNKQLPWLKELVMQNAKNQIKKVLIKTQDTPHNT